MTDRQTDERDRHKGRRTEKKSLNQERSLKTENYQHTNFFVTGDYAGCHNGQRMLPLWQHSFVNDDDKVITIFTFHAGLMACFPASLLSCLFLFFKRVRKWPSIVKADRIYKKSAFDGSILYDIYMHTFAINTYLRLNKADLFSSQIQSPNNNGWETWKVSVLVLKTDSYHGANRSARYLWKLARCCKQLCLLCSPDSTKFTRYCLTQ